MYTADVMAGMFFLSDIWWNSCGGRIHRSLTRPDAVIYTGRTFQLAPNHPARMLPILLTLPFNPYNTSEEVDMCLTTALLFSDPYESSNASPGLDTQRPPRAGKVDMVVEQQRSWITNILNHAEYQRALPIKKRNGKL